MTIQNQIGSIDTLFPKLQEAYHYLHLPKLEKADFKARKLPNPACAKDPSGIQVEPESIDVEVDPKGNFLFESGYCQFNNVAVIYTQEVNSDTESDRVFIARRDDRKICGILSIEPGRYFFALEIDGTWQIPDFSGIIRLHQSKLYSMCIVENPSIEISVKNTRNKELELALSSENGIMVQTSVSFLLKPQISQSFKLMIPDLTFASTMMVDTIMVVNPANGDIIKRIPVKINFTPKGNTCSMSVVSSQLEEFTLAKERNLVLKVRASGKGDINGLVVISGTGLLKEFSLSCKDEHSDTTELTFTIPSINLPHERSGFIEVLLTTDSYISNHQFQKLQVPFTRTMLETIPFVITIKPSKDFCQIVRFKIRRSDGGPCDIDLQVPETLSKFMSISSITSNDWILSFSGSLNEDTAIQDNLIVHEKNSDLFDYVPIIIGNFG